MASLKPQRVREAIAAFVKRPMAAVRDDTVLTDLVTESFVLVEMVIELQETFGVRLLQEDLQDVKTVGELLRVFERKAQQS